MKIPETLPRGIQRRGDSLIVYLTIDGKRERRSVGHLTIKEAVRQREIWQREIDENKYIKVKPRVLFDEIADRYLQFQKDNARGWDRAETHVRVFKSWFKGRDIETITPLEIEKHINALKVSKRTKNEYRTSFVSLFNRAVRDEKTERNPALNVEPKEVERGPGRELSVAEEVRLREAIEHLFPEKMPELDLALNLGCRRSNLYGIRDRQRIPMEPLLWENVNLDFRVVNFPRSKNGNPYTVPINRTAEAAFRELRKRSDSDGQGPVIRAPRPEVKPHRIGREGRPVFSCRRWFEQCLAHAKIEGFCYHSLRHTFASRLRARGVSLEDIGALLGHTNGGTRSITGRYAHANLDALRKAVALLDPTAQTARETATCTTLVQFPRKEKTA